METPYFILIQCRVCRATTVVLGDRRPPKMCARCRAPYDPDSATFEARPEPAPPRKEPDANAPVRKSDGKRPRLF